MRHDDHMRFLEPQDMTWRQVEYMPPVIYCKRCRWRDKTTSTCGIAHYVVGPSDFCSKGERSHDDAR